MSRLAFLPKRVQLTDPSSFEDAVGNYSSLYEHELAAIQDPETGRFTLGFKSPTRIFMAADRYDMRHVEKLLINDKFSKIKDYTSGENITANDGIGKPIRRYNGALYTYKGALPYACPASFDAVSWDELKVYTNVAPPTYAETGAAPLVHTHAQSDIVGLVTALAGKAPTSHVHTTAQVTGLDTALAGKSNTGHTHAFSELTSIPDASTTAKGIVQLSSSVVSYSTTTAATSFAVRAAYDKALEALNVATGGLTEAGGVDLSTGVYPTPLKNPDNSNKSCFWKVTVAGVIDTIDYQVNDTLVYSASLAGYYKIDNTESAVLWEAILNKPDLATADHTHAGASNTPIVLTSEDLDNLTTPNSYSQNLNANATAARHYPENQAGALTVTYGAGPIQTYYVYNSSRVWRRAKYSTNAWTAWARDYNTLNKPTAADVGALAASANAVSASKLLTARNLNLGGVDKAFDGTADVDWGQIDAPWYNHGGITDAKSGMLLVARKYVGTAKNAEGFIGRVVLQRGASGSTNFMTYADVVVYTAYTQNRVELVDKSIHNTDIQIVEVTYNSEVWYALYSPSSSARTVYTIGKFYSVPILIADATAYTPTLVATNPTNYSSRYKPSPADIGALAADANAVSADKLITPRSFTIGGTTKTFDGTADVTWDLTEMGAAAASHTHPYMSTGNNTNVNITSGDGNGLKLWNGSTSYTIYMSVATNVTYGGEIDTTSDYNMYFKMGGAGANLTRGFMFIGSYNATTQTLAHLTYNGLYLANGWFRSYGNTGWVNDTYGGGVHMTDETWVRIFGSKALYVQNEIAATGEITAYYSDRRLKTNFRRIHSKEALKAIARIHGWYYTANELAKELGGYDTDKLEVGLVTQEVEKVIPEIVAQAPFDIGVDEKGNRISKSGKDYKTLRYERLAPFFVEAIHELENLNKDQSKRISSLEKKLEKLERIVEKMSQQ